MAKAVPEIIETDRSAHFPLVAPPFQPFGHVKTMAGALAITGTLLPPAWALKRMDGPGATAIPKLWHRAVSRLLGVKSQRTGDLAEGGVLYVANHISWLDIPLLGSHLKASFVAKSEVGNMGLVSLLADLQGTIYVERERRAHAALQANSIQARLEKRDNIILFPEGTSGDGVHVLPFKSSLFSVTEGRGLENVRIQPISLAYTRLNGLPLTRHRIADIAWVGDTEFGPHAMDLMRLGRIDARVICHEPVKRSDFVDRKALARYCHDVISTGYRQVMRGLS